MVNADLLIIHDPDIAIMDSVEDPIDKILLATTEVSGIAEDMGQQMPIHGSDLTKGADSFNHVF